MSSARAPLSVSCATLTGDAGSHCHLIFDIKRFETVFCAMEENPKIITINVKKAANFLFVFLVEENGAEQLAIALG
jgi:hypothetical protein